MVLSGYHYSDVNVSLVFMYAFVIFQRTSAPGLFLVTDLEIYNSPSQMPFSTARLR